MSSPALFVDVATAGKPVRRVAEVLVGLVEYERRYGFTTDVSIGHDAGCPAIAAAARTPDVAGGIVAGLLLCTCEIVTLRLEKIPRAEGES